MTDSLIRTSRSRRAVAFIGWGVLVLTAVLLIVARGNGVLRLQGEPVAALVLSLFAAFVGVFSWLLFNPGRRSAGNSPALAAGALSTLIPPPVICYCLLGGSALAPWLTLGVFLVCVIAILSEVPDDFFGVPRDRSSYFVPLPAFDRVKGDVMDPSAPWFHFSDLTKAVADVERPSLAPHSYRQQERLTPVVTTHPARPKPYSPIDDLLTDDSGLGLLDEPLWNDTDDDDIVDAHLADQPQITPSGEPKPLKADRSGRRSVAQPTDTTKDLVEIPSAAAPLMAASSAPPAAAPPTPSRQRYHRAADAGHTAADLPAAAAENATDVQTVAADSESSSETASVDIHRLFSGSAGSTTPSAATSTAAPETAPGSESDADHRSSETAEQRSSRKWSSGKKQSRRHNSDPAQPASQSASQSAGPRSTRWSGDSVSTKDQPADSDDRSRAKSTHSGGTSSTDTRRATDNADIFEDAEPETQQVATGIQRTTDDAGVEYVEGVLKVRFDRGQKRANLHVPFSPPLPDAPQVECECVGGDDVRLKVPVRQPYGIRIEARRSHADEAIETEVGFAAVSNGASA